MKYKQIDSKLFIENRKNFVKKLLPNSIVILHSNDIYPTNADGSFDFKQNSDLFYLTGMDQEETILVLMPDYPDKNFREVLFTRRTNELIATWEGHKYTQEEATYTSGIKNVIWADEFYKWLNIFMNHCENCYLVTNEHDRFSNEVAYKSIRFANEMREKYPLHTYHRATPIIHQLRMVKSKIEVEQLQTAMDITEKAFRRILKFVKPNVTEYEIEAEITHEFLRNRATGHAYSPIIASGENACVLHYVDNNQICKKGDLLLMDFGAEYANYSADLSRTIPVSGKFTPRQKAVYNAVLRVMKKATAMLRPGTLLDEYHKEVGKLMESELIGLKLLDKTDVKKQDPKNPLYKKYFMHGTSHYLGLDTHDVGDKYMPIKAGNVFTCEPGIYIRKEKIGIRLENDILVTAKGQVDLMKNIPIEVEEIEELMNS